ncbi:hypothetical protein BGZ65_007022, partial [Modicella reniformis]
MEMTTPPGTESKNNRLLVLTPLRQTPPIRPATVFRPVRQQPTIKPTALDNGKQVVRETDASKEKSPPLEKRSRSSRLTKGIEVDSEGDGDDDNGDDDYRDDDSFITDASDSLESPPPLRQRRLMKWERVQ